MPLGISRPFVLGAGLGMALGLAGCAHYQAAPLSPGQSAAQLKDGLQRPLEGWPRPAATKENKP
jgi:hypothetical protein